MRDEKKSNKNKRIRGAGGSLAVVVANDSSWSI